MSSLACAVVPELLPMARLAEWTKQIAELRARLVQLLARAGLEALPSDAPFVLVPRAPGVREQLARHGVLVRDTASFGCPDGVRVAVPGAAGLERLAAALEAIPR